MLTARILVKVKTDVIFFSKNLKITLEKLETAVLVYRIRLSHNSRKWKQMGEDEVEYRSFQGQPAHLLTTKPHLRDEQSWPPSL